MKKPLILFLLYVLFSVNSFGQTAQGVRSASITGSSSQNIRIMNCVNATSAFTIEAWIYPMRMLQDESTILIRYKNIPMDTLFVYSLSLKKDLPESNPFLLFRISDGTPSSTYNVTSGPVRIPMFQWTHVAGTFDGANIRVYINGIETGTASAPVTLPPAGDVRIGLTSLPTVNRRFFGCIDELKFWNMPLNSSALMAGMNGIESPAAVAGLVGYWKMEDDTGITNICTDASASMNDGDYRGGTYTQFFTPFDPQGLSQLSVSPSLIDFGVFEESESQVRMINITNSSPYKAIGFYQQQAFLIFPYSNLDLGIFSLLDNYGTLVPVTLVCNSSPGILQIPVTGNILRIKNFDANNMNMRLTRNGRIALQETYPVAVGGLEWPKGSGKHCLYQAGLWLSAPYNGDIHGAAAHYNSDFQAGPEQAGTWSDPDNTRFRIYKISRGDSAGSNIDYAEWPADLGAPVNTDGTPMLIGDQTLFTIYNDLNPSSHIAFSNYPTLPMGAEVKQIIYGWERYPGALNNTVFIKYIITNKSSDIWSNTTASFWSDIDIGDAYTDYSGCDPSNNLGFNYKAYPYDAIYGTTTPAVALHYLKGPIEGNPMQSFAYYINGGVYPLTDPSNRWELFNFMNGLTANGTPYFNPVTGTNTTTPLDGNPVTGTGWNDGMLQPPGDRRIVINSAPFSLNPGQTITLDFAITVSTGTDNIDALNVMRTDALSVNEAYLNPPPRIYYVSASSNNLGTVSPSGITSVTEGGSVTYNFTPNPGYQIKSIIVDGINIGTPAGYTFNNVRKDHQVYAAFADLTPPVITLKPSIELWPANHKMVKIQLDKMISKIEDNIYGSIPVSSAQIDSVTCDEPKNSTGDGNTIKDIIICGECKSVELRAEREGGGNGRVYTVYLSAADSSGNIAVAPFKVTVPKNQGKWGQAIDDGPVYTVKCECGGNELRKFDNMISAEKMELPVEFKIAGYPNPFNPSTTIIYSLPEESRVEITIYNTIGQKIETLVSSDINAGIHRILWNAGKYSSGMYILKISAISKSNGRIFSSASKLIYMK